MFFLEDLKCITDEKDTESARTALESKRKAAGEQEQVHQAFLAQQIPADAIDRLKALVRRAAEEGQSEVQAPRFPAAYCTDHGRAVNNFDPDWPKSLTGFAATAYGFFTFTKELQPLDYKIHAEILTFSNGNLGDVGLYLRW